MTHEDFKNIISMYHPMTKERLNNFLDGITKDDLLSKWFDLWKNGDNRPIFDEIAQLNQFYFETRQLQQSKVKPKDHDKPIGRNNKNVN